MNPGIAVGADQGCLLIEQVDASVSNFEGTHIGMLKGFEHRGTRKSNNLRLRRPSQAESSAVCVAMRVRWLVHRRDDLPAWTAACA